MGFGFQLEIKKYRKTSTSSRLWKIIGPLSSSSQQTTYAHWQPPENTNYVSVSLSLPPSLSLSLSLSLSPLSPLSLSLSLSFSLSLPSLPSLSPGSLSLSLSLIFSLIVGLVITSPLKTFFHNMHALLAILQRISPRSGKLFPCRAILQIFQIK